MRKQSLQIEHIPALLWGEPADKLMIAVHGDGSHKADTVIDLLAEAAAQAGCQLLSFDLPEHGDRQGTGQLCKVQTCVGELGTVMGYARTLARQISLFGCSIGAYFSLAAYREEVLEQCLFLSPVVDMARLIGNMMQWAEIGEQQLREQGEIPTAFGKTLYWDYYHYVREHPITKWDTPTAILRGERDTLSEYDRVSNFAQRFHCDLTVMPEGEHFFHTQGQLDFYRRWLAQNLQD